MRSLRSIARASRGFTMIEILAVVIIIGMAVSIVALSMNETKGESVTRKEAQALIQAIEFVSEQAVFGGEIIGMFVESKNVEDSQAKQWCYHWKRFRDESWQDLPAESLDERCMPENMQWDMVIEGHTYTYDPELEKQDPVLVWSPSGEATPIEMKIYENATSVDSGSKSEAQRIEIDMMGGIHWLNKEEEDKRNAP